MTVDVYIEEDGSVMFPFKILSIFNCISKVGGGRYLVVVDGKW